MTRPFRFAVSFALPLLAACATHDHLSDWVLYPRPLPEAGSAAARVLRELGYHVTADPAASPDRVEGRYADAGRTIIQRIDLRPAGSECEVRIFTCGDSQGEAAERIRNAHERLVGALDAALRAPAPPR